MTLQGNPKIEVGVGVRVGFGFEFGVGSGVHLRVYSAVVVNFTEQEHLPSALTSIRATKKLRHPTQ